MAFVSAGTGSGTISSSPTDWLSLVDDLGQSALQNYSPKNTQPDINNSPISAPAPAPPTVIYSPNGGGAISQKTMLIIGGAALLVLVLVMRK